MAGRELISMRGLDEFRAGLRKMDSALPREVQKAANKAAQLVVARTRPRIPTGPARNGHVRSSLKVASSQRAVRVAYGGSRYPYAGWLDFGGRVGRKKSVKRQFIKQGRYVWKSYAEISPRVRAALDEALDDVARKSGISITGGGGR